MMSLVLVTLFLLWSARVIWSEWRDARTQSRLDALRGGKQP